MSRAFKLEDPGEGIREAEILEVRVSHGDQVNEGDHVLDAETDKSAVEIRADFTGTIEDVKVSQGSIAKVGEVLMTYDDGAKAEAEPSGGAGETSSEQHDSDEDGEQPESGKDETDASDAGRDTEQGQEAQRPDASDQEAERPDASDQEAQRPDASEAPNSAADSDKPSRVAHIAAAPSTRRLARELGIDFADLGEGSGPAGRVLDEDVRAVAEHRDETKPAESRREQSVSEPTEDGAHVESEREPLKGFRRATAQRMKRAWAAIPHVVHHDLADIDRLDQMRREHAELVGAEDERPSLTAYLVKALAGALGEHRRFNAQLDEDAEEIVYLRSRHIGIAVATNRGLLVPVVRDADRRSLREVARELRRLSDRARSGDLERKEMRGASITLTNVGSLGGRMFTPIINPPQCSILGIGAAFSELVPSEDGDPQRRLRLPLSFAFDHRLNDGADAARFVNSIKRCLSSPAAFALSI